MVALECMTAMMRALHVPDQAIALAYLVVHLCLQQS